MNRRGCLTKRILLFLVIFVLGATGGILLLTSAYVDSAPLRGGKIVFAAARDIDTLDPHTAGLGSTRKLLIQFMETLVVHNYEDGKLYPGLAESWEVSRDGKTYTFRLRRGVKFHDGTPVDAAAVKFSFDRIKEAPTPTGIARGFLGPYEGSEVLDPYTVRVRLQEPYAPFLRMLALAPLGPVSPTAVKSMGEEFARRPVAAGPYMVKEWIPKDHVTLVRNPNYNWASPIAKHQGAPYPDEVVWRFIPESTTRTAVLQTGEVTIAEELSYADVAQLERSPDLRILRGVPAGTPWTIFPNTQRFPTNDLAVRLALHHAINKDVIARVVFRGQSRPASSPLQPSTPGYTPVARELFPYDPIRAKKLLDEAGWKAGSDGIRMKEGKRLEVLWIFGTANGYEEMAPLVQAMAREVGIDIQLREQPRVQMYAANQRGENNIGETQWWFSDPFILTNLFHSSRIGGWNFSRLNDPEVDKLLDQASAMVDEGARLELYKKIQRMIVERAACIPLVDQVTVVGMRKELKDYRFSMVTFPVLADVYLDK